MNMTRKEFMAQIETLGGRVWESGRKLRGYFAAEKNRRFKDKLGYVCYSGEGIDGDDANGDWVNDFVGFVAERPGTVANIRDLAHDVAGIERKGW